VNWLTWIKTKSFPYYKFSCVHDTKKNRLLIFIIGFELLCWQGWVPLKKATLPISRPTISNCFTASMRFFFFNFSLAKKPLFENDYNKSKAHQYFLVLLKKCLKYKYILSRKNKNKIIFTLENISGMTCLASTAWISSLEGQISAKNISFPSWSWASGSFSKSISTRPARA
jgi:hypothetical protein